MRQFVAMCQRVSYGSRAMAPTVWPQGRGEAPSCSQELLPLGQRGPAPSYDSYQPILGCLVV